MDINFKELLEKLNLNSITLLEAYTTLFSTKAKNAVYNNLLIKYNKQKEYNIVSQLETDIELQEVKYDLKKLK